MFVPYLQITGVAGYVIGRRGAMIRDLQAATNARITINDSNPGAEVAEISASSKADMDAAVAKINEAIKAAKEAPARPAPVFTSQIQVRKPRETWVVDHKLLQVLCQA